MLLVVEDLIIGLFSVLLLPLYCGSMRYCSQDKCRIDVTWVFGAVVDLSHMGEDKLLIFLYGGVVLRSFTGTSAFRL